MATDERFYELIGNNPNIINLSHALFVMQLFIKNELQIIDKKLRNKIRGVRFPYDTVLQHLYNAQQYPALSSQQTADISNARVILSQIHTNNKINDFRDKRNPYSMSLFGVHTISLNGLWAILMEEYDSASLLYHDALQVLHLQKKKLEEFHRIYIGVRGGTTLLAIVNPFAVAGRVIYDQILDAQRREIQRFNSIEKLLLQGSIEVQRIISSRCKNCHKQNRINSTFCNSCGKRL